MFLEVGSEAPHLVFRQGVDPGRIIGTQSLVGKRLNVRDPTKRRLLDRFKDTSLSEVIGGTHNRRHIPRGFPETGNPDKKRHDDHANPGS